MFQKANGSQVWLRAPGALPYLVLRGAIETMHSYAELRRRLGQAYRPVPDLACGDVFLMDDSRSDSAILFGARPDLTGDLIVLGRYASAAGRDVLPHFNAIIDAVLSDLVRCTGMILHLRIIEPELALRIG